MTLINYRSGSTFPLFVCLPRNQVYTLFNELLNGLYSFFAVNGVAQSSAEKPRSPKSRDSNVPTRARTYDNVRNNRPVHQDHKDAAVKKLTNHQRDERGDGKRSNSDRTTNKYSAEGREKEPTPVDPEALNNDRARHGHSHSEDNRYNNRTDHHERSEKPFPRSQASSL